MKIRIIGFRFLKRMMDERNECADALRAVMRKLRDENGDVSGDPMYPFSWDAEWERIAIAADKALAKVPTVTERMRRIWAGLTGAQ